jgi:hypothetical protein
MKNANPNSKLKINSGKESKEIKYESLSLDSEENTKIYAGHGTYTVKQLQQEIDSNSEIGKKLRTVEKELDKY